ASRSAPLLHRTSRAHCADGGAQMIDRPDNNARTFFDIRVLGRLVSLSLLFAAVSVAAAHAETKNVKIMMDWIIQGTHAPFFVAQDKG
ncbi:MAG: hypothetical protein ACXU9A_09435, partial [Xanthobacteraceae bacterium]